MKLFLSATLLALLLACAGTRDTKLTNPNGSTDAAQPHPTAQDKATVQTVTISEQGISFGLPKDWQLEDELDNGETGINRWRGPNNTKLIITVLEYKPEYRNISIEEAVAQLYEEKKSSGSKDVRFLEIGGVKGVHYLDDLEVSNDHYEFIKWDAQYMYKGRRRIISVSLACPISNLSKQRDSLYGILHSIKFLQA